MGGPHLHSSGSGRVTFAGRNKKEVKRGEISCIISCVIKLSAGQGTRALPPVKCSNTSDPSDYRGVKAVPGSASLMDSTDPKAALVTGLANVFGVKMKGFSHCDCLVMQKAPVGQRKAETKQK